MGRPVHLSPAAEVDVVWRKAFLPAVNWVGISQKRQGTFYNVAKQMVQI
jgi:hypothetical protein